MTHKKNKFWNFWFSCIPGAGQMYQGFMKKGVSLMVLFWGLISLIAYFRIDEMLFCLPIIWFYGFFDGIHTNSLPDGEFVMVKDEYLFVNEELGGLNLKRFRIPAACLLILIGGYSLLHMIAEGLVQSGIAYWDSPIMYVLDSMVPKTIFSIVVIGIGLYLIRGKRVELENEKFADTVYYQEERASKEGTSDRKELLDKSEEVEESREEEGEEV